MKLGAKPIPCFDLTLVLGGEMCYDTDGKRHVLREGDVIFLTPGTLRAREAGREAADYVSFNFETDRDFSLPTVIRGGISREVLCLIWAFDEIEKRKYLPGATARTERILSAILLSLEDSIRARNEDPLVQRITAYLHKNLAERVTLGDVAEHCFFSPVYCDAVYKKKTGRPIIATLLALRIEEAKSLLLQEDQSVKDVAAAVGFEDSNYFSRVFKKQTGMSPTRFCALYSDNQEKR